MTAEKSRMVLANKFAILFVLIKEFKKDSEFAEIIKWENRMPSTKRSSTSKEGSATLKALKKQEP